MRPIYTKTKEVTLSAPLRRGQNVFLRFSDTPTVADFETFQRFIDMQIEIWTKDENSDGQHNPDAGTPTGDTADDSNHPVL